MTVGESLVMSVADDGVGLPAAFRPGVGLRSMRDRAAELGGALEIDRRPRAAGPSCG